MSLDDILAAEAELVEEAKIGLARDLDDHSFLDTEAIDNIAATIMRKTTFAKLARRYAKTVFDRQKRPGKTPADGNLWIPGLLKPHAWEPRRLVSDDAGRSVEFDLMAPRFKAAQRERLRKDLEEKQLLYEIVCKEDDEYQKWAVAERLHGRPVFQLTWGNCVREKNFLRP